MDEQFLLGKIQQLSTELEQSAGNHNVLLGRMMAYKELLAALPVPENPDVGFLANDNSEEN